MSWAQLLKRVFEIHMEHCPHCGGTLKIIVAIEDPSAITKILAHLALPTQGATSIIRTTLRSPRNGLISHPLRDPASASEPTIPLSLQAFYTFVLCSGGVYGLDQEGEDIKVVVADLLAAIEALQTGRVSAATAMIALQWLALNRDRVRSLWCG